MIALSASGALAQQTSTSLDGIVVSAERTEGTVYDSPSTVSSRDDKEISRQNINQPRDLVRDEPGVSVGNQPARGGQTNYVIRGIGENRVRVEVDGTKLPDFPGSNIGAGNYTRNFVDFDSIKRVEIIRGPASALYGSDAIGGVISYITKDPADYLAEVNKNWFASLKGGFDSSDLSRFSTITGASRLGSWESMILYTHRVGNELKPNGPLKANPQDFTQQNVLAKVVYNTAEIGQFKFTGEFFRNDTRTQLVTEEVITASPAPGSRVFDSNGDDRIERPRFTFDWNAPLSTWFADTMKAKVYYTSLDRIELTSVFRAGSSAATAPTQFRFSDFRSLQDIYGSEVQFASRRIIGDWTHNVTYGLSFDQTETTRPRDRFQQTLATGAITRTISGETYPNKNFPDTTTQSAGVYVQDIAEYGRLRLIPAVRFDYYHLTPFPDADFARSNTTGIVVNEQTETAVSPKLGGTYDLTDNYRVFAQYARGFRSPPYDNANFGFRNAIFGYQIIPNGNLSPETSDGFEGGLRGRFNNGSSFQLSAFYNKYKNFIDTVTVGTVPVPNPFGAGTIDIINFQYQNLPSVTIFGFEGKGEWQFHPVWSVFGAFAYAEGENDTTGAYINSIDPLNGLAGLRYREGGWIAEARVRAFAAKNKTTDNTFFKPEAFTTVDALVSRDINNFVTFNVGLYNIFDESYFNPQEVVGLLASTTATRDLFRATGRTLAVNMIARW